MSIDSSYKVRKAEALNRYARIGRWRGTLRLVVVILGDIDRKGNILYGNAVVDQVAGDTDSSCACSGKRHSAPSP